MPDRAEPSIRQMRVYKLFLASEGLKLRERAYAIAQGNGLEVVGL